MRKGPSLDLYHAATVAADALAEVWGGAGVATLLAWGEPAEIELLYCRGLREEVCHALSTAAGRRIVEGLRRAGEPVILETGRLKSDAKELKAALESAEVPGLLLVPVPVWFGSTGVVCVELGDGERDLTAGRDAVALAQVDRVTRCLRGLSLAASASALAVALAEEHDHPDGRMDAVVVLDRWERIIFSFGLVESLPGWSRQGPFGRPVDGLPGGPLLAELPLSEPGALVWEEHLFPPVASGSPVAAAAVPFARRGEETHGRMVFFRDLRAEAATDGGDVLLDLALRVASDCEGAEAAEDLLKPGPDAPMGRRFDAFREAVAQQAGEARRLVREAVRRTAGDLEDTRTDLNEVLERTLRSREKEFLAEGIRVLRFLRPELTAVPGDPVEIQRILSGLVEHSRESLRPGGGTLTVRTWEENGEVYMAVSDDGRGVASDGSVEAFRPLMELDSGSRSQQFLEEARESIEPWDGRLMVESRPGLWNRITLMLPGGRASSEPAADLPPAVQVQKGDEGLEVLVVDDNPSLRSVMRRYLERRGHTVTEAEDGGKALELIGLQQFDRVVVDVRMPGTDGPTFFKTLDDVAPEMRERIIFMTGGLTERSVETFILSTGRPAIQKPFDLSEMARTVEE